MSALGGFPHAVRQWLRPAVVLFYGYDGFVSYSRRDAKTYAHALQQSLESRGLTICLDKQDLTAGSPLATSIENRIRRAPYFVLLDSPEGIRSRYVREELRFAHHKNRQVVRVVFPLVADSAQVWRSLVRPYDDFLTEQIWLDERDVDPCQQPPSTPTVDEIVRAHVTRRKRGRFLASAAVVLTMLSASIGLIALSSYATKQANDAIDGFRDAKVSLQAARNAADGVLGARLVRVYAFFANAQHWQLRNLINVTYVKRINDVPNVEPAPCVTDDGAVRCVPSDVGLRLSDVGGRLRVTSSSLGSSVELNESAGYQKAAASNDAVAVTRASNLILWRTLPGNLLRFDKIVTNAIANLYHAMAFSRDGRYLFVLNQSNYQTGSTLTVVDVPTGTVLQSVPILSSAAPNVVRATATLSNRSICAADEDSLAVEDERVKVCAYGAAYGFDVLRVEPPPSYLLDEETRGNFVPGAAFGPDQSVVYWLVTNKIFSCTDACMVIKDENSVHDFMKDAKIHAIEVAAHNPPDGTHDLLIEDSRQKLWRCSMNGASCTAAGHRDGPRRLATTHGNVRIEIDPLGHAVVTAAEGSQLGAPDDDLVIQSGATATAAALTPSASTAVIALAASQHSSLAVGIESRWGRMHWHELETTGRVLAVTIADDGNQAITLERWNAAIVKRSYQLSGPVSVSAHSR